MLRRGYGQYVTSYGRSASAGGLPAERALAAAGLVLRLNHGWELPREVAVAAWLTEREMPLTGRPPIARAEVAGQTVTGQSAAQDFLRGVGAMLDVAGINGIAALKKGGVGLRERTRLAARLRSLPRSCR